MPSLPKPPRSLVLAALLCGGVALPASAERWVASWAAAPLDHAQTIPVPGAAPPGTIAFGGQTLRQRVQPTVGGEQVRVRFSNLFGRTPLRIDAASVARTTGDDGISPGQLQPLRFGGQRSVTIAPGAELWSDAAALAVEAGQVLSVSFHLAAPTATSTGHPSVLNAAWVAPGNEVMRPRLQQAGRSAWNPLVTGLDVARDRPAQVVVAFGDSITDGSSATDAQARRYPERLAERLRAPEAAARPVAVLNAGISGNRLLADRTGPRGLARFERDVLGQSGVTHVIVLLGINDIGYGTLNGERLPPALTEGQVPPSAEQITAGLQQLIERARAHGVKVLLGTLLPFKGSPYWSEENEAKRQAVNRWIRGRQDVDAVIDFDAALRNPRHPQQLDARYDSGDRLHPSDAGYVAMAEAVDVNELRE